MFVYDDMVLRDQEDIVITQQVIPLGDYPVTPAVEQEARRRVKQMLKKHPQPVKQEVGKEPTMNECKYDDVQASRKYLKNQVAELERKTADSLAKKFGLVEDTPPAEGEELVERINAGKFRIPTETERRNNPWKFYAYGLIWRSVDADRAGFDAAAEKLKSYVCPAWDAANVLPVDQALVQLETLRDNVKALLGDEKKSKK